MIFKFDDFTLDTKRLELRRKGSLRPIEPQVFSLLEFLIENRDRVVDKQEVVDAIWQGRAISDSTLSARVNSARRAVDDNGTDQEIIKTVRGRGFRFVRDVSLEPEHESRSGGLGGKEANPTRPAANIDDRPVIAVLPFHDLDLDSTDTNLAFGLTDDLTTALGAWRSFPVIARNSCYALRSLDIDVRQVSEELGARYIIEGSIRRHRDRVRVVVQVIDGINGHCIWLQRYDTEYRDILKMQDEIAKRIAATAVPEIEEDVVLNLPSIHENLGAWECYQHGMRYLGRYTMHDNDRARTCFHQALQMDPEYSRAYSGLSFTYHREVLNNYTDDVAESAEKALKAALQAVDLDDADPLSNLVLGYAHFWSREPDKAINAFERTLELNPSDAMAHVSLGAALDAEGRADLAIPHLETGIWLNPRDPRSHIYCTLLARAYLNSHQYEKAVEWARKSVVRKPEDSDANVALLIALGHLGRRREAQEVLSHVVGDDEQLPALGAIWKAYSQESIREHLREGLRKAGLKSIPTFS